MHSLSAFYFEGGEKMQFKEAFEAMKKGKKVKYPNWGGSVSYTHLNQMITNKKYSASSNITKTSTAYYVQKNLIRCV